MADCSGVQRVVIVPGNGVTSNLHNANWYGWLYSELNKVGFVFVFMLEYQTNYFFYVRVPCSSYDQAYPTPIECAVRPWVQSM